MNGRRREPSGSVRAKFLFQLRYCLYERLPYDREFFVISCSIKEIESLCNPRIFTE